jgi:hypothetical protein
MSNSTSYSFPASSNDVLAVDGVPLPGFTVSVTVRVGLLSMLTGRRSGVVQVEIEAPEDGGPSLAVTFDMTQFAGLLRTDGASITGRSWGSRSVAWAVRVPWPADEQIVVKIEDTYLGAIGKRRIAFDLSDPKVRETLERLTRDLTDDR